MPRVPSPAAALIGERIRHARAQRGLTQDELAVLTGIDSSNVRAYEAGRALLSLRTLIRIAESLGVEAGTLLSGVESAQFVTPAEDGRSRRAL